MKKLLAGILASTMILSTATMAAAQETTPETQELQSTQTLATASESDFTFENGMILKYVGSGGDVVIPSTINGQPVIGFEALAFQSVKSIKTMVIPEGVTTLNEMCFRAMTSLTSVTLPNSITTMESGIFAACTSLKELNFPNGIHEIPEIFFGGCDSLTSFVVPDHVTKIGDNAFYSCDALTDVHIPSSVHTIGQTAFHQCKSLTSIEIPKSVTTIDRHTFWSSDNLTDIYFEGTQAQWNAMKITMSSEAFLAYGVTNNPVEVNATVHFNSTMSAPPANYPDWATDFVDFVSPKIMPDISTSNFNDASNRGLIAQSFYNMYGNGTELVASHSFTDVGDFGTAVTWCHGAGVMSGTGQTTFGTYGNVNREQFCLILKQMATVLEKDTSSGDVSSLSEYSDSWSISDWAKEGVAWATANNLMAGSNGALNPHGDVTRLEVAIMLSAFDKL